VSRAGWLLASSPRTRIASSGLIEVCPRPVVVISDHNPPINRSDSASPIIAMDRDRLFLQPKSIHQSPSKFLVLPDDDESCVVHEVSHLRPSHSCRRQAVNKMTKQSTSVKADSINVMSMSRHTRPSTDVPIRFTTTPPSRPNHPKRFQSLRSIHSCNISGLNVGCAPLSPA
jgi:hypothetical protein